MPNFYEYNPEQGYLLPPSVREVLGEGHLCFFVHRAVEKLNLEAFVKVYSEEGASGVSPGADAEGVVVRVRGGDHEFAAAGGTDQGRFGVAVFGGRGATGLLGAERFSETPEAGSEQHVHAGGGAGAEFGDGEAGTRGDRLDADRGERGGGFGGHGGEAAQGTGEDPEANPALAAAVRGGGSERRSGDGGGARGAGKAGTETGRASGATAAAEEIGAAEAFANG